MSKARYITAMSLFGALFLVSTIVGVIFGDDLWVGLLSGYGMGVTVAELIFWRDSLCTRLFLFFANIAKTIVVFWITFFVECIPILILIGIAIASPLFTAAGAVFSFGAGLFGTLAPFLFIYHAFAFASDLY
jgi:hypothetical protein